MTVHATLWSDAMSLVNEYHGETVILYPGGDLNQATEITAIVISAQLEGRNMAPGDGPLKEEPKGRSYRHSLIISVPVSTDVDETRQPPDLFRVFDPDEWSAQLTRYRNGDLQAGELYGAKHFRGTDSGMTDVECVRRQTVSRRRQSFDG